jgi:hypothetical protein
MASTAAPSQAEAFIGCQTGRPSPLATQNLSVSHSVAAVNQQSAIVLLDAVTLTPQQALPCPQHVTTHSHTSSTNSSSSIISGVAMCPSGRHVAAYTQQQLLVSGIAAAAPSTDPCMHQHQHKGDVPCAGRLQAAALLPGGIRSIHWSPNAAGEVLAVCSRNEVGSAADSCNPAVAKAGRPRPSIIFST